MFGRAPARAILYLVALYYTLASSQVRRAVTSFRGRLGVSTGFGATYRTVLRFAQCSLDALFQLRGMTKHFRVERNGHEILGELRETGTSAILLGAHLGSIHAMRSQSRDEALPVVPVVYTKNARRFNRVLEELDPTSTTRLIEIGDGDDMDFMLAIRERAESGALIAILGDRTQPGAKTVDVDFLGAKAQVPAGPYILAATLRLPVYFTVGIYRGGADYEFFCIPFADRIVLPRGKRQEAIAEYAQKYADLLTEFCRKEPDNWFNFFDFWSGQ
ncbi:MAG: acyl-CoA synthetase [Myxococcota bacterium]